MRKASLATLGSLFLLISAANCTIPDLTSEGGTCPCASGYTCDATANVCRREAASTSSNGGSGGIGGSSSLSNGGGVGGAGGASSVGGAGGAGGQGGVGACGGANVWVEGSDTFWDDDVNCNAYPGSCVTFTQSGHDILCCPDKANQTKGIEVPAFAAPSTENQVGELITAQSWFVCWLRGERFGGSDIWFYTDLDKGAHWGYVSASSLVVPSMSAFDPMDPDASNPPLPHCPCP